MNANQRTSATDALERDHAAIVEILGTQPKCRALGEAAQNCRRDTCEHGSECWSSLRKTINALMFSTIAHFDRETEALRLAVCREDLEAHGSEHISFTGFLTDTLQRLSDTGDCFAAMKALDRFGLALHHHMATADAQMLKTRLPT